jgi:hypothetical protein
MNLHKPFTIVVFAAAAVFAVALPTSALAVGSGEGIATTDVTALGAWKAAHDTDPHTPIVNGPHHTGRPLMYQGAPTMLTVPSSFLIGQNQQGQQQTYWCGPAAEAEADGLLGSSYAQSSEASTLKTTTDGTAWSGVNANVPSQWLTQHPMRDVLVYHYYARTGIDAAYAVVAVPYTPTQSDINKYISNLTFDISNYWPVIGDAWEVAGYPHLTNHPHNLTIFHWFTVIGYQNYGNQTWYEDSATTMAWTPAVPAYTSNFDTPTLVLILGGRGYIW